ncbi:phage tail-collar fiber domain-containing protein [Enterobacter hormaechei]|uniref:phage tail-collar fiber domain-containing protein n=1 Tax=Enterobacter hormaechei TaxID=158836 RepID=UPI00396B0D73
MSQTAITLAFEQWKASQAVTGEAVLLDEFVFANVPGLDATKPIDRKETLPPAAQIVHRQAVSRKGVVNENAVVHSVVLGAEVGDFSFNWIGLINKASNTLAMIVHAPLQQKLKTKDGQQGNVLNRATGKPLQKTPVQRQIESHYPELASGMHLPKFGRVMNPVEAVKSGNFSDPFRPRYAVDVQLLDADGNPEKDTPVYSAVPLPVPMAGNDSGMFQFPPEGTLVEIAFTGGRPDKPFVRQTVPEGTSLPDIQPGEQLQQQRAEVSQRVTQAGDWVRQTDQTISETSMARVVKADTEQRELVSRETTVKATDKLTVLGTSTLLAGAIQQVCTGDYSQAVNNRVASIGGNDETDIAGSQTVTTGKDLIEKIGQIRKSVAAVQQQIIAPVVWIGSDSINVAQLMLETLDVVKELAEQTASHTHSNTGAPTNAGAIRNTGTKADTLNGKYSPVIGK